jgi:hypothetical protein
MKWATHPKTTAATSTRRKRCALNRQISNAVFRRLLVDAAKT